MGVGVRVAPLARSFLFISGPGGTRQPYPASYRRRMREIRVATLVFSTGPLDELGQRMTFIVGSDDWGYRAGSESSIHMGASCKKCDKPSESQACDNWKVTDACVT